MFEEWGFLITEMIGLLAIAALLGLFIGWLIWGRRQDVQVDAGVSDRLREDLDKCRALHRDKDARIETLEADLNTKRAELAAASTNATTSVGAGVAAGAGAATAAKLVGGTDSVDRDLDGDGVIEGKNEGTKPKTLSAARGGKADDLKQIKGVGPKMEKLCNKLGFYHFDQIAEWNRSEVAWVDANLEGFKGRVSRDNWVAQAKVLAKGGTTEFSNRVKKGDIY